MTEQSDGASSDPERDDHRDRCDRAAEGRESCWEWWVRDTRQSRPEPAGGPAVRGAVELAADLRQERHEGSSSCSRKVAMPRLTRLRITNSDVWSRPAISL